MKLQIAAVLGLVMGVSACTETMLNFRAVPEMNVIPIDERSFRVGGVPRSTPASQWCAAGRYAQGVLRVGFEERLYVVGDYERGQTTWLFSLDPDGTASEDERVREFAVSIDGANVKVNAALAFCRQMLLEDE